MSNPRLRRTDTRTLRIALTGGIACGKSLLSGILEERGFEILDADDIVHGLIPDRERRKLAAEVFSNPAVRKRLESRIHPIVRERIEKWLSIPPKKGSKGKIASIPLLFEVQWDKDYDIILCVVSSTANQIERMTATRGYSAEEAVERIGAQMDVSEKAARSHYTIHNDSSRDVLEAEADRFVAWLEEQSKR